MKEKLSNIGWSMLNMLMIVITVVCSLAVLAICALLGFLAVEYFIEKPTDIISLMGASIAVFIGGVILFISGYTVIRKERKRERLEREYQACEKQKKI